MLCVVRFGVATAISQLFPYITLSLILHEVFQINKILSKVSQTWGF